jgi:hypothetical protein
MLRALPIPWPLLLFLKGSDQRARDVGERLDGRGAGVRCPSCRWRPSRADQWTCHPGCEFAWNTFETRGECPACGKRWTITQCLRCGMWHAHEEWYQTG